MTPSTLPQSKPSGATKLRRPVREEGFTLIELTVTVLVFGIVMTFVAASFLSLQQGISDNFVRQAGVQNAQLAMEVISRDVRAIADDPNSLTPLIYPSTATTLVAAVNIDTKYNPAVTTGSGSAFNGCPDQVTIAGPAGTNPGPITETRLHPVVSSALACTWPTTNNPIHTRTIADNALLQLVYLASPIGSLPVVLSAGPSTTTSIQITVVLPPSGPSRSVTAATIVQTTPLATFNAAKAAQQ